MERVKIVTKTGGTRHLEVMKSSCSVAAPKRPNEMPRCCLFFGREIGGLPLDVGRTIYDTDLLVSA
jgi:hypothetical protein